VTASEPLPYLEVELIFYVPCEAGEWAVVWWVDVNFVNGFSAGMGDDRVPRFVSYASFV
jgi:hypothetical protein